MEETSKKISFGFSKVTKKPLNNFKPTPSKYDRIQLIDRLEDQVIKTIEKPIVIQRSTVDDVSVDKTVNKSSNSALKCPKEEKPDSELTEDEIAARELLRDAQNLADGTTVAKAIILPVSENPAADAPTLDDYEAVPIKQYGLALLKQLGWKEGEVVGKDKTKQAPNSADAVVPRRFGQMGLGCDISAKLNKNTPVVKNEKDKLVMKAGSFGKILAGKHKSNYCEVQGFDFENPGSIIAKLSLTGNCVTVPEAHIQLVTKEEYNKSSKVINIAKYEAQKMKLEAAEEEKSKKRRHENESDSDNPLSSKRKENLENSKRYKDRKCLSPKSQEDGYKKSSQYDCSRKRDYEDDRSDYSRYKHQKRSSSCESEEKYYKEKSSHKSSSSSRRRENDSKQSIYESDDDEKYKTKSAKSSKHKKRRRRSSSSESEDEKYKSKKSSKHKEKRRHEDFDDESSKYDKPRDKKKHKMKSKSRDKKYS